MFLIYSNLKLELKHDYYPSACMHSEGYSSCRECVCLSVCLCAHASQAVRAIKRIVKDNIVLSVRFTAILVEMQALWGER